MWPDGYKCRWVSTEQVRLYLRVRNAPRNSPRAEISFSLWGAGTHSVSHLADSPVLCFDPSRASRGEAAHAEGLMDTPWGPWPAPYTECWALRERTLSGQAEDDVVYDVYWKALCMFPELRAWMAEQFPQYWDVIERSYPQLTVTPKE